MKNKVQMKQWDEADKSHGENQAERTKENRAGTLIVLPTVAITQWCTEIARFTRENSLTIKVYHGTDRETSIENLQEADVVITSYKIVEIEYRKATAGTKVVCRLCNKKFYPD